MRRYTEKANLLNIGVYTGDLDNLGSSAGALPMNSVCWITPDTLNTPIPNTWGICTTWGAQIGAVVQRVSGLGGKLFQRVYYHNGTSADWHAGWSRIDSLDKQDAITGLTNSMVMICNSSGKITTSSTISTSELAMLDGVTTNIQTQFNRGFIPRGARNVNSSVTDYNNMTDAGVYWIQNYGLQNGPIDGSFANVYGWLEVTKCQDGQIQQKFIRHPTFDVYMRDNVNGWKGWRRIDSHYVDIQLAGAISHETVRQAIIDNVIGSYHAFIARISSLNLITSSSIAASSAALMIMSFSVSEGMISRGFIN